MSLDLSGLPIGGYGVILTKDHMVDRGVLSLASEGECFGVSLDDNGELKKEVFLSSSEFSNLVNNNSACYKLLFSCDQAKCIQEDRIIAKLRRKLDEETLQKYTTFSPISLNNPDNGSHEATIYMFKINFPRLIKVTTRLANTTLNTIYLFSHKWCESGLKVSDECSKQLMDTLYFLNYNGVFHNDIKDENVMMCQGKGTFIDFGSTLVDEDPNEDLKKYYKPKAIVYPIIQEFYKLSERGSTSLSRSLIVFPSKNAPSTSNFLMDRNKVTQMMKKYENMPLFHRYLFHKNDCFLLANLLFLKGRRSGGGFLCFGKPKVVNNNNVGDLRDQKIRTEITNLYKGLDKLLFFDEQDFAEFRERYRNCQMTPGQVAGALKERKRYKGRSYVVRTGPRGGKYILRNSEKVYL